jgi:hypothetical protein
VCLSGVQPLQFPLSSLLSLHLFLNALDRSLHLHVYLHADILSCPQLSGLATDEQKLFAALASTRVVMGAVPPALMNATQPCAPTGACVCAYVRACARSCVCVCCLLERVCARVRPVANGSNECIVCSSSFSRVRLRGNLRTPPHPPRPRSEPGLQRILSTVYDAHRNHRRRQVVPVRHCAFCILRWSAACK